MPYKSDIRSRSDLRSRIPRGGKMFDRHSSGASQEASDSLIPPFILRRSLHLFGGFEHLIDRSLHVKRLFRNIIVLAFDDLFEAAHGVLNLHIASLIAGKLLRHMEGLREELLDLTRASDGDLVFFRKLVDSEDGDDVLQVLIPLQDSFHALR